MGRSPCCEKAHTNKGAWTKEEDERLIAYIKAHGEGCWRSLPKAAGLLRCGKAAVSGGSTISGLTLSVETSLKKRTNLSSSSIAFLATNGRLLLGDYREGQITR
ncbi:hypothetical protein Bca52824_091720 [Brassica carinata]|uniref:Uncharacterized protein n=1 Tax=Brassica carinata TaxID=52824 RepID=A0A8X7TF82_BRACI|nr:hypothetical protein Bca52824_091720 [Brassica carinata]